MNAFLLLLAFVAVAFAGCPFATKEQVTSSGLLTCPHKEHKVGQVPDVTDQGCTCRTICSATLTEGLANCDWCYTQNSCGHFGALGYWDYCIYPTNKTYEAQSADDKTNYLWSKITEDQTSSTYPNVLTILDESIQTSFDDQWDVFPAGRKKIIHSVGAVCKFTFAIDGSSPYTGVFAPHTISHGFVRMGSALPVDMKSGVVPGLGIKFMRSGVPSGNFVALYQLGPLPNNSYNFFQYNLTNHIPAATGVTAILAKKFTQASGCVTQVGLSDICKYTSDGQNVTSPVFPYRVSLFSPNIQFPTAPCTQDELQQRLTAIPAKTPLFDFYAYDSPQAVKAGQAIKIGTMVTDEACVNSRFGDEEFYIRHQRIEEDWALRPDWMPFIDPAVDCSASSISLQPPAKCSKFSDPTTGRPLP